MISDPEALVAEVRAQSGPERVPYRADREDEARARLDARAGLMTQEEAKELLALFNQDYKGGAEYKRRFSPAFVGSSAAQLTKDVDAFNLYTQRLWREPIAAALRTFDEMLADRSRLPGAGRSFPTMLFYLRDPQHFAVWLTSTARGLSALDDGPELRASGGVAAYERYCERVRPVVEQLGLQPQEIDLVLWAAMNDERARARERADAEEHARPSLHDNVTRVSDDAPPRDLQAIARRTGIPLEQLSEWVGLLSSGKRQALFYGPPGTGKTFVAQELAKHLAGSDGLTRTVQFHGSYSYEDFIEGLRPVTGPGGTLGYEVRAGIFRDFCEAAERMAPAPCVLVVDEINRADLSVVMGELMLLLEYRGEEVELPYSRQRFRVPENVVLLGTLNTADRSLTLLDFAVRRRFHAISMRPDRDALAAWLERRGEDDLPLRFFDLVTERVGDWEATPGHAYWMTDDTTPDGLRRVWEYELEPYLAEYWFERREELERLASAVATLLGEEA